MSQLINKMEQVRKIKIGAGIQSILDDAYKILGNPLVMFNTEYDLIAYTDVETDDPIWNELVAHGSFSKETHRFFEKEGFIEEIANSPRIAYMKSEKLKYDRIAGKVFNRNNAYVSNLIIIESNRLFDKNDAIVFEAICKLVSKEISRSDYYQEYEQTHQEAIMRSLIDGTLDIRVDVAQVGILYDSLKSNLYIAVADISLSNPKHDNITYYRDVLMQLNSTFKYAIYSYYIVIIISTNEDDLNVLKELDKFIHIFEMHNIYAGISSRFENLFEMRKYYIQAVNAMQFALDTRSDQRIFPCNESSFHKMDQIKDLENGKGIQYFLNTGAGILGNPLLFHDMELNLLAYTENMEIADPIWQELITYGTSSYETIELFRTEGFIDIMDNTKGGGILISDKIEYDRISWRIYNSENIRIGCTSIVNTINQFSEDELVLFGAFSQRFSREVGKIEFYSRYGQVYSETIINRLITGKIDDYTFYSEDISNLYDDLMENLYLIVIDTTQCESDQINLTYFRELFNWPGTINRYAIHEEHIIIIISIDCAPLSEKDGFREIGRVFEQNNIYAGISSWFDNIYELPKHYVEAVSALSSGVQDNKRCSGQWIYQYNGSDYGA